MNIIAKFYHRTFQALMRFALLFISIPSPRIISKVEDLLSILNVEKAKKPLIVTGGGKTKDRLLPLITRVFEEKGQPYAVYSGVVPNPNFACIEEGKKAFDEAGCDVIIALGGGSPMDASKLIAASVAYPKRSIGAFKGLLKVRRRIPLLIAIPTTVGSGSEASLAAVISNEATHDKFQVDDPHLVPKYALLDPTFVTNLPKKLIAETGMDTLTHALESLLGRSNTAFSKAAGMKAMKLLDEHLLAFYENPEDASHAEGMQLASYQAGLSFTRAYVGYVHALSHAAGGYYGLPHGYANAVLLPYVLEAYGDSIYPTLAEIYDELGRTGENSVKEKAKAMLTWINTLRAKLGIPETFGGVMKEEDYPSLALHAAKEANPFYPVPRLLDRKELQTILEAADGRKEN